MCCHDSLRSGCGFKMNRSIEQEASLLGREEAKQTRYPEGDSYICSKPCLIGKLMETERARNRSKRWSICLICSFGFIIIAPLISSCIHISHLVIRDVPFPPSYLFHLCQKLAFLTRHPPHSIDIILHPTAFFPQVY